MTPSTDPQEAALDDGATDKCGVQISMAAWGEPDEILTCTLPAHSGAVLHREGDFAQWEGDDPNTVAIAMAGGRR